MTLILNKNKSSLSSNCSFQYHVYFNYAEGIFSGKVDMDDFNNNEKLQLIYENISSSDKSDGFEFGQSYYINASIFNNSAEKFFGDSYVIPEAGYSGCGIQINYDDSQGKYKLDEALAGDESIVTATNIYTSAKMNNDTLVIVENVHFSYPEDIVTDEVKQNYSNDLTLEYTFKKESDKKFYFYSIERK